MRTETLSVFSPLLISLLPCKVPDVESSQYQFGKRIKNEPTHLPSGEQPFIDLLLEISIVIQLPLLQGIQPPLFFLFLLTS